MSDNIYDKENEQDKKNLIQLRSGTADQQMINAAYMGARSNPNMMEHMELLDHFLLKTRAGYSGTKAIYEAKEAAEKLEHEELMKDIEIDAQNVINMSGSLPKGYFDKIYEHVEGLRTQYADAKRNNNEQEAAGLRAQLNTLSVNIGQTKENILNNSKTILGDDGNSDLTNLSLHQERIISACKEKNAVFHDGTLKWTNPNYEKMSKEYKIQTGKNIEGEAVYEYTSEPYREETQIKKLSYDDFVMRAKIPPGMLSEEEYNADPEMGVFPTKVEVPNQKNNEYDPREKEYYTIEDFNKATVSKDYVFKENNLSLEKEIAIAGQEFKNGTSTIDFDKNSYYKRNLESINKENIQFLLRDDFGVDMTFEQALDQHPDMMSLFNIGEISASDIVSEDLDGDGVLDYTGDPNDVYENTIFSESYLNSPSNIIKYDTDGNKIVTWEDFGSTPEEARKKLIETITQPDATNFNYDISRDLLADYMTRRQEKIFYKDTKPMTWEDILQYRGKTLEEFEQDGGSIGFLKTVKGIKFDDLKKGKKSKILISQQFYNRNLFPNQTKKGR